MIQCTLRFCFVVLTICQIASPEEIVLRDGLPNVHGAILSGGDECLLLKIDSGNSLRLPWSSIQSILPIKTRPRLQQYMDEGEALWRAKQRVVRGDIKLSEPIFAQQFQRLFGLSGADARLASEGYLRVLLARGSLQQAVLPWIETVRLQLSEEHSPFSHLQPIVDDQTLLCPHLPIFALDSTALKNLLSEYSTTNPSLHSIVQLLRNNYKDKSSIKSIHGIEHPEFLGRILLASRGVQEAMNALEISMRELLPWQKVWAHYAIGLGYLQLNDEDTREKGLIQLVYVASADPSLQPWLTGAAMLLLSNELLADGLQSQAERIQHEFNRLFPTHPLVSTLKEKKRNNSP